MFDIQRCVIYNEMYLNYQSAFISRGIIFAEVAKREMIFFFHQFIAQKRE